MYKRIQLLLMSRQLNKADLAKAIGVSSGNLSDWANGRSQPSVEKLVKIADFFGVSTDYILGREDRFPTPSPDSYELVRIYENLDREGRTIVMAAAYGQKQRMGGGNE